VPLHASARAHTHAPVPVPSVRLVIVGVVVGVAEVGRWRVLHALVPMAARGPTAAQGLAQPLHRGCSGARRSREAMPMHAHSARGPPTASGPPHSLWATLH